MTLDGSSLRGLKFGTVTVGEIADLGEVSLRRLNVAMAIELSQGISEHQWDDATLVSQYIQQAVRTEARGRLSDEQVSQLVASDRARIAAKIIEAQPDWFSDEGSAVPGDEDAVSRADGEEDETLIARGIRAQLAGMEKGARRTAERVTGAFQSLTAANLAASQRVKDLIGTATNPPAIEAPPSKRIALEVKPIHNPIHDTNEILGEVARHIGQMRELADATAEMQSSLNDIARRAVDDFANGAKASADAASRGLKIAEISAFVAVLALLASILVPIFQGWGDGEKERTAAARSEEAIRQDQELVRQLHELRKDLAGERAGETARIEAVQSRIATVEKELENRERGGADPSKPK